MSLNDTLHAALDKLKHWFDEEKKQFAEHLGPVANHLEELVVAHLKDVATNVSAVVVQGILQKKDAGDIKKDALNAVKVHFKVEANEALHEAAAAVALAVAKAHLDIHPDYTTVNK